MGLLLNRVPGGTGHGGGQGTQCLLYFGLKTGLQKWICETREKFWSKDSASVVEDQVREPLNRLRHIQVPGTRWDIYPWLLKVLIDVTARPLLILKGQAQERLLRTERRQMFHPVFKKENVGNYSLVSLIVITGKMSWEKIVSEEFSKHTVENMVMRSSWHQFMKEKLCSISLIVISL